MKKFIILLLFLSTEIFCSYFDIGVSYFLDKNYDLAEYWFKKSYLLEDKDNKNVLLLLSNVYYLNEKYNLAEKTYQTLFKNCLLDTQTENFVKFMIAECNIYLGRYDETIKFCDKIDIQNFDKTLLPYLYYIKIFALYKTGEYNSVLTNISLLKTYLKTEGLVLEKNIVQQVDYILAESWYAKGDYKNAIENFKKVVSEKYEPELSIYANLRLAAIYEEQKKFQQAETSLKSINSELIPSEEIKFLVRYNTAKLFVKQNKFQDAIKIYNQLVQETKNNDFVKNLNLELAYCYFQLKNYDKTISVLSQLKFDKKVELSLNTAYLLGLAYYNNKNYTEAIKIFSRLIKERSKENKWYDDAYYLLGLSYFNLEEYKKSIKVFYELCNKKSSVYYVSSQIYIAQAYKELKEYELAKNILIKLLENKGLDEGIKSAVLYELAECYKLSADYQIALKYYGQILSMKTYPKLQNFTKFYIAEINFYQGQYSESEKILTELLNNTKSLDNEVLTKSKLLYAKLKYISNDYTTVEKIVYEILPIVSNKTEKKFLLTLLVNMYIKTNNFDKTLQYTDKLLAFTEDSKEKFLLQLKILRLLLSNNMYQKMFDKVLSLQKEYTSPEQKCIMSYFVIKYYQNVQQEENISDTISKLKTFLPQDYNYYTKNEIVDMLNLSSLYNTEVFVYLAEHIVVSSQLFNEDDKIEVLKKSIEYLISNKNFSAATRMAALVKKITSNIDAIVYSEFVIGRIYELTDKKTLAENVYKSIIEKYPNSQYIPKVCISLLNYYSEKGDTAKLSFYKNFFLSKYPDSDETSEYLYNESLNLVKENRFEDAIKNLSLVVNTKNKDIAVKAQKLVADCYYSMNKYKEAAVEYLQIIYLFPDKPDYCAEAQYMVGICAEKLKLYDEAKKAYKKLKTNYPDTLWAQESELRLKQIK
jgi:tetratricopeptide (TPR) repeat protein